MTQQVTGLPQGVTHVSPVYPLEQVSAPAPVAKPPRAPWIVIVAAVAGGAIAWLGASGYYGAADVRAMRSELAQAQAAMQQQQQILNGVKELACP
jgi:hypothetical protein